MFGDLHGVHITNPKLKYTDVQTLFKLISIVVLKVCKYVFSRSQ